ncbi:MAG: CotH kinase family protein [Bacteroidales bacterium]|nr:CotH kinase family protein [Bacteroidales bacterium]
MKLLFTIIIGLFFLFEIKAQVVINEILAINASTNIAEYSKNYADWIELFNTGDEKIDIGGWFFSDDKNIPAKWKIPSYYSINAHGFEIFWADNENISNHANFKLNGEGETLYLYNADTCLVDSINFPAQFADISYGRISDSCSTWKFMEYPSPNIKNSAAGFETPVFSEEVVFSVDAGFYKKAINLEISSLSNNSNIYYTIDGAIPTSSSQKYTAPIKIEKSTVVRARNFAEGKLPGDIKTSSYFINEIAKLPVLSLSTDGKNLWSDEYGIYVPGKKYNPEKWETANYFKPWQRPVNIEYFNAKGQNEFNIMAGMKVHGRSTRNNNQKTLAIFLKDKFGTTSLNYKLFENKPLENYKSFLIRSSGNDWGCTMFKDAIVHCLIDGKIDMETQAYQPAIVYLNANYWGIHNIREKINADYLSAKYQLNPDEIDIVEANALVGHLEAAHGNMQSYNQLVDFIKNHPLSEKANYDKLKELVDVDECINYFAIQVIIANADFPGSNLKCWKQKSSKGKWRWILYDTEYSLGWNVDYFKANAIKSLLEEKSTKQINPPWSNYFVRKVFENDEFKNEFIQRTAIYLETIFSEASVYKVIDSLKQNIAPEINRNLAKWGGLEQTASPYFITSKNTSEWENNIDYIKGFIKHRGGVVRKNFMNQFGISDTLNLKLKVNDEKGGRVSLMGFILPDGTFNGQIFAGIPLLIEAIPNEGYEFVKWKEEPFEKKCTIILVDVKKLTAVFRKKEYNL